MSVLKHTMLALDYAAMRWNDAEINMAILLHDSGKRVCWEKYQSAHGHEKEGIPYVKDFCSKWKVPNSYRDLALISCEFHTKIHGCMSRGTNGWMRPKSIQKLFEDTGALRNPERFRKILKVCEADAKGRGHTKEEIRSFLDKPYHQRQYIEECLQAVLDFNTKDLSKRLLSEGKEGKMIGDLIRQERIAKIRGVQNKWKERMK